MTNKFINISSSGTNIVIFIDHINVIKAVNSGCGVYMDSGHIFELGDYTPASLLQIIDQKMKEG